MKRRIEKAHIMNINIILLSNELMIKIRMVPYTKLQRGCLYLISLREWGSNSNARVRIEQVIYCSSIYSRSPEKAMQFKKRLCFPLFDKNIYLKRDQCPPLEKLR